MTIETTAPPAAAAATVPFVLPEAPRRAARFARGGERHRLVRTGGDPHLRAARSVDVPDVPRPAGVPGLQRAGLPAALHRAHRLGPDDAAMERGPHREPVHPRHDPSRARRAHPRRVRQDDGLRLLLPQQRHQARARRTRRAVDERRRRVQLAAAPSTRHLPARRVDDRDARRRKRDGVVQRPRPLRAHARHARHPPAPRQLHHPARRPPAQPHEPSADLPLVGECGRPRSRRLPVVLP